MARIPTFTRSLLLNRANPSNVSLAGAPARSEAAGHIADAQRAEQHAQIAQGFQRQYASQKQAEGKVKAQTRFNEFERTRVTALHETLLSIGFVVGSFMGGWISDHWDNRRLPYLFGAAVVVASLIAQTIIWKRRTSVRR